MIFREYKIPVNSYNYSHNFIFMFKDKIWACWKDSVKIDTLERLKSVSYLNQSCIEVRVMIRTARISSLCDCITAQQIASKIDLAGVRKFGISLSLSLPLSNNPLSGMFREPFVPISLSLSFRYVALIQA